MLQLVRTSDTITRSALVEATGMSRSTVVKHIHTLLASGLILETDALESNGGRPPGGLLFNRDAGIVLSAVLGVGGSRAAVCHLGGEPLVEAEFDEDLAAGPERVLGVVQGHFEALLSEAGGTVAKVRGIALAVPGPVEVMTGTPVWSPSLPGWHGFSIPGWFASRYPGVPTIVDRDVNVMAFGEHWVDWHDEDHLLYVRIDTSIGCGIVSEGRIHRGRDSAAGDIAHMYVPSNDIACRCGSVGCLETVAGGSALAAQLAAKGHRASASEDVVQLVREGNGDAMWAVRMAGRHIGRVLATCVSLFNPRVIVVAGSLADEHLLTGVRELVAQRSCPSVTSELRLVPSRLGDRAGVIGAASMLLEQLFSTSPPQSLWSRTARTGTSTGPGRPIAPPSR